MSKLLTLDDWSRWFYRNAQDPDIQKFVREIRREFARVAVERIGGILSTAEYSSYNEGRQDAVNECLDIIEALAKEAAK